MQERHRWVVHDSVADMVDNLLRGRQPTPQVRTVDDSGKVTIQKEIAPPSTPTVAPAAANPAVPGGWRASGRMEPVPVTRQYASGNHIRQAERVVMAPERLTFQEMLNQADWDGEEPIDSAGPNGEDLPLHVYPYGISSQELDQIIDVLQLPVVLTKDMDSADAVLALRTHIKNHAKLRQVAKGASCPFIA